MMPTGPGLDVSLHLSHTDMESNFKICSADIKKRSDTGAISWSDTGAISCCS